MIIKKSFLASLTSILLIVGGCSNPKTIDNKSESDKMFIELKELLLLYSDSLKNAADSASITNIVDRYESELTKTIYKYPAESDLQLTQGQQDTIASLTENFVSLKRLKYSNLLQNNDSIATDSITVE